LNHYVGKQFKLQNTGEKEYRIMNTEFRMLKFTSVIV